MLYGTEIIEAPRSQGQCVLIHTIRITPLPSSFPRLDDGVPITPRLTEAVLPGKGAIYFLTPPLVVESDLLPC